MKLAAGGGIDVRVACRHRVAPVIGGTRLVAVFNLLRKRIRARDIMTREAFENAIVPPSCFRALSAVSHTDTVSVSVSACLHLPVSSSLLVSDYAVALLQTQ